MDAVFKKLNYKNQSVVVALNAPESFEMNLESLENATIWRSVVDRQPVDFVVAFATKQSEVNEIAHAVGPLLAGDAVFWIAYPKGTSKKYSCDFNRDTGWSALGNYGLEPVRQVAIDEDWSALRFRKVEFIKTMTRNKKMILSEKGLDRVSEKKQVLVK